MMQVAREREVHDVVVIGSGASGGMTAYNLTQKGVKVLMLDAGTKFDPDGFWSHVSPYEQIERQHNGEEPPNPYLSTREQPYLTPDDKPFDLARVWGWGGKTNVWGRVSLRMSDLDFAAAERDGWGIPWPIRYADLAPYYDKVEQLIGVCGGTDSSDSLPGSRYHLPSPAPRCAEVLVKKSAEGMGIPVVPVRRAVLTQRHRGFPPCHYCGACGRGCRTSSFFNATDYLLADALETGRLDIVSNSVVARVLVDENGRANGVQYFDRRSGREEQVRARVVVVAASTMDSTRILLNSRSPQHPNGLGNGNDQVGRNYCEQVRTHIQAFLPQLFDAGYSNDDGISGAHVYIPRFNHRLGKLDYLRGFGIQMWATGCGTTGETVASSVGGFGASFKREVKKKYPALVQLHPYGETLPRADSRVTVDETQTDAYGVPLMRISVAYGENERKITRHMTQTCEEILHNAGAEIMPFDPEGVDVAGTAIHEHGTMRMGDDPKLSVVNQFQQMHEVPNVFVVDGSVFPNASEKNPTLSILALSWRASDALAELMRQGTV